MRSYFENFVKYVFMISKSCYNIILVNAFVIVFINNCEHRLLVLLVIVRLKFFKNNLSSTNALRLVAIYIVGSTSKRKTSLSRTLVMLFKFLYDGWILMSKVWRTLLRQSGPDHQTAFTLMTEGSQTRTSRI